jgi:transcriptional regulator with XRE-family HTH domain
MSISIQNDINNIISTGTITMKKKTKEKIIGERIKEVFVQSGLTVTEFAALLRRDRTNVYNIFRRKTIDTRLLSKLSKVLKHHFVEELCAQYGLPIDITSSKISLILEINSIDIQTLNKLLKVIKRLEIKKINVLD